MNKRSIRNCVARILPVALAIVMVVETPMISYAASNPAVFAETVSKEELDTNNQNMVEEVSQNSEPVGDKKEGDEPESGSLDENKEANSAEVSEMVNEEGDVEIEEITGTVSTAADFVITNGVLTSYTGTATEIVIPGGVTSIADSVFKNKTSIKSVVCPSTLKTIGESAFRYCDGLQSVELNEGLVTIGNYAFDGAEMGGLDENRSYVYETLVIPSTVSSIGHNAFSNCTYLGEVIFTNKSVASLSYGTNYGHNEMFRGCGKLKKVTLANRATEVPDRAFQDCTSLEEVVFGNAEVTIKTSAFENCKSLKRLECPETLKTIGESAFRYCTGLQSVELNEGLVTIGNNAFDGAGMGGLDENRSYVYETLVIPSTVSSIGHNAFSNCTYLGEVIFTNKSVASLSYGTNYGHNEMFRGCGKLKKVTLANRATEVPDRAFQDCTSLEEVVFGNAEVTIKTSAFENCKSLKRLECPETLKTIGESAFRYCTGLQSVELNEGLVTIGNNAFDGAGMGGLDENRSYVYETLVIPSTVSSIGHNAFSNCTYLGEVIFTNKSVASLSYGTNYGHNEMFRGCGKLKKVTLANRATEVPDRAFQDCTSLEEVVFGNAEVTIKTSAFENCKSLKRLECPETLATIGESAFRYCTGLQSVELNEGLVTIGNNAFDGAGMGGLDENRSYVYETLVIPSTVSSIGHNAFSNCTYLGEVIFTNKSVASLSYGTNYGYNEMFRGCGKLKKVTLANRATEVPDHAFKDCTSLEEVIFGNAEVTIKTSAFENCKSLKRLECPETLATIGESAFRYCTGLQSVELNEGLVTIGNNAFDGAGMGGINSYGKIIYSTLTIPSTVSYIGAGAFKNCDYLDTVNFLNGKIQLLEWGANYGYASTFAYCDRLKTVYLPDRATNLRYESFEYCKNLTTIYIPQNVTTFENDIFYGCDLTKLVIYGDTGSAAETYAKANKIRFKNKLELGLYAKSITLNRSKLYFAGVEATGEKVSLLATILPSTAQNKAVEFTSTNTSVATVDAKGVVTVVGYGETDIVATSLGNSEISASCHVEVNRKWTEEELNTLRDYMEANNDYTVLSNVYQNIQELVIVAPEGITAKWKLPYGVETGANDYDMCISKDGYQDAVLEDVTVTGITVTGIVMNAKKTIQVGKESTASVVILTEGGSISNEDYQIEWRSACATNVSATEDSKDSLKAVLNVYKPKKETAITAKVVLNRNGQAVSVVTADKGITWFESSVKVVGTDYAIADDISITATQNGSDVKLSELKDLLNIEGTPVYELTATVSGNGEPISNALLTWNSSNAKVAKVVATRDGKVTLTLLGKGSSTISVVAAKNGGYTESFKITVKDSTPRLETNAITMNAYRVNPEAQLKMYASDGYAVDEASLELVDAKTGEATPFEVTKDSDVSVKITVKEGKSISKGTYALNILAKTSAKEVERHKLFIKIKVEEKSPKITIKQKAIDLYSTDSRGKISITTDSSVSINQITYIPDAGIGSPRLVQDTNTIDEHAVFVKSENLTATNYKKTGVNGTLVVKFDGYKDVASYSKRIKLSANNKLPVIKAIAQSPTLYPGTLADATMISLFNNNEREEILKANGYSVGVSELTKYDFDATDVESGHQVEAVAGAKSGSLVYTITNENWISGVNVTSKCALKIGKVPALTFNTKKLVLNTAYTTDQYDAVSVDTFIKGFENVEFDSVKTQIVGKDAKSSKVLEDGALELYLEDGAMKAGIVNGEYFTKTGDYSYIVTAYSKENQPVRGTLKLSVVLKKSTASVSFKLKGTINPIDRTGTYVIATPTVKNYTGTIEEANLYGMNAGKFEAKVKNGNVCIYAKDNAVIKTGAKYLLKAYVTLDSGVSFHTSVTVTPKQKNPKLTQSSKNIVLFETAKGLANASNIKIDVADNTIGTIKNISLAAPSDTFGYDLPKIGDIGYIYVKDTASLVPGKTYTVKLAVTFEGDAVNAKPSYVTIKVKYCK